jgi:phosphate transport system substrate-binding protein
MNKKFFAKAAAVVAVLGLATTATPAFAGDAISGKGSSFANNALQYCLSHYDPATGDTVTYTSTGSGTGRTEFAAGNVDFAASDGTYAATDKQPAAYQNIPLVGGPVVFAYNKNSGIPAGLKLSAEVVSGILKGTITKWNAKEIAAINKGAKLPAKTISVFYRTSGSGTTENLTNYLAQVLGTGWTKSKDLQAAAGGTLAPTALAKATSSVIADKVESTKYAFGYFDLSDAVSAKVSVASLKNQYGNYVAPTAKAGATFLAGQAAVVDSTKPYLDGTLAIDFKKEIKGAYQLTIVTYGLAPKGGTTAKSLAVEGFFKNVVSSCLPSNAAKLGYVALPSGLKSSALTQIEAISTK